VIQAVLLRIVGARQSVSESSSSKRNGRSERSARPKKERRAAREFEQRRLKVEAKEKEAAREAEAQRLAAEEKREQRAIKERRLEVTREQAERNARLKAEQVRLNHEIRLIELKARQAKPGDVEGVDGQTPSDPSGAGNLALQTKRFGDMIRHVLPKMPLESAELPQFFEIVKKTLRDV